MGKVTQIRGIQKERMAVTIVGTGPLIQHAWDPKVEREMLEKQMDPGKRTRVGKKPKDPEANCEAARHKLLDGRSAVRADAIKNSMVEAAHTKLGIPKTDVRKAVFIEHDEWEKYPLIELKSPGWKMREDMVKLNGKVPDIRHRPMFAEWEVDLRIIFDAEMISPETIVNLLERAGFGVGIGEWRPEKNGQYGTFEVKRSDV